MPAGGDHRRTHRHWLWNLSIPPMASSEDMSTDHPKPSPDPTALRGVAVPLVDIGTQDLGLQPAKGHSAGLAWDMDPHGDVVGYEGMATDRQIVPPAMVVAALKEGVAANYPPTLKTLRLMPFVLGMTDADRVRFFLEITAPKRNPDPFLVFYFSMGLKPGDYRDEAVVSRLADALYDFDEESEELQEVVLPLARVAMVRAFEHGAPSLTFAAIENLLDSMNRAEGRASTDHWPFPAAGHPAAELASALRSQNPGPGCAEALVQLAKVSHLAFDMLVTHVAFLINREGHGLLPIGFRQSMEGIAGGIMQRGEGSSLGAGETLLRSVWIHPTTNAEIVARARRMDETDLGALEIQHLELVRTVLTRSGLPALDPASREAVDDDQHPDGTAIIREALAATEVPFPLLALHRRAVVAGLNAMLDRALEQAVDARRQRGIVPPMPRQLPSAMEGLFLAAGAYGIQEAAESLSRRMMAVLGLGWTWIEPKDAPEEE